MKKATIIRITKQGTIVSFDFELDTAEDHLRLTDIRVKGASIIDIVDIDIQADAYNEGFQKWIMTTA